MKLWRAVDDVLILVIVGFCTSVMVVNCAIAQTASDFAREQLLEKNPKIFGDISSIDCAQNELLKSLIETKSELDAEKAKSTIEYLEYVISAFDRAIESGEINFEVLDQAEQAYLSELIGVEVLQKIKTQNDLIRFLRQLASQAAAALKKAYSSSDIQTQINYIGIASGNTSQMLAIFAYLLAGI